MPKFVFDEFNGPPDTQFGGRDGDIGADWKYGGGLANSTARFDSTGTRLRSNNANANSYFYGSGQAPQDGSYCDIEYDVGTSLAGSFGPVVRASASSGYAVVMQTSSFTIRRLKGTVFTTLTLDGGGTTKNYAHSPNTTHKMRISATGTGDSVVVQVFIDNVLQATVTDTSADRVVALNSVGFNLFGSYNESTGYFLRSVSGNIPQVAANALTLSGPAQVTAGQASQPFTVETNGTISAPVTVTPAVAEGGTISPASLTLQPVPNSTSSATFSYTANSSGTKTISITNNAGLINPAPLQVSALALPSGVITSQPNPDGQVQRFVGTTSDADSGTYTLTASNPANTVGPLNFEIVDGNFDFFEAGLNPDSYTPTLTLVGPGGSGLVSGTRSFSIMPTDGGGVIDDGNMPVDTVPPVMTGEITFSNVTASSFQASWPAATDNVGVTGYEISTNGQAYVSNGLATSYTATGLFPSTSYTIRVRALDAAGNRSNFLERSVSTTNAPDTTAPTMLGDISVVAITQSSATIGWITASDNVEVTGYEVSLNAGVSYINVGNVLSYNAMGLSADTIYEGYVRAYDAAGNRSTPLPFIFETNEIAPGLFYLEVGTPIVIRRTSTAGGVRLVLNFIDSPAPRSRTIILGGQSTTITA